MLGEVDNDILLMKSNRYGDMEWQQSFGGSQMDIASHIEQASDGGFIISATTESYGQGGKDIWLFKTSSSGLIEWNKYIGTPYDDYSGQVLETDDGGFILIGSRGSSDQNDNDIWLIKTILKGTHHGQGLMVETSLIVEMIYSLMIREDLFYWAVLNLKGTVAKISGYSKLTKMGMISGIILTGMEATILANPWSALWMVGF